MLLRSVLSALGFGKSKKELETKPSTLSNSDSLANLSIGDLKAVAREERNRRKGLESNEQEMAKRACRT